MPESHCSACGAAFWSSNSEGLIKLELDHHNQSFEESPPGSVAEEAGIKGNHKCKHFMETGNGADSRTKIRIYNSGGLVETY
jgi:hypothetical protein